MNAHSRIFRLLFFLVLAGLVSATLLGGASASLPAWSAGQPATPVFLSTGALPACLPAGPSPQVGPLPTSTIPGTPAGVQCSVTSSPANPSCSTQARFARCSAQNDSQQVCSAFASAAAGPGATCSTFFLKSFCSVLAPNMQPAAGPSECSAFELGIGGVLCSTWNLGKKQFCSAQNPAATNTNQCSTFAAPAQCSVFNQGANFKSFCTTVFPGASICSAQGPNQACSIVLGGKGVCTAFKQAPAGGCSALGPPGAFCSVLGGPAGNPCRQ